MEAKTKYHGVRHYSEEDIILFDKGLPGFENLKKYILFPVEDNESFQILHSIEDMNIGLIVISPFEILENYEVDIPENVVSQLKISDAKDVFIYNTVNLHSQPKKITVNLRAPLIINIKNKLGQQIILNNDKYAIKHPMFKV
ncbi:flagellar assembly protein FliW [Clostridium oryzae]|uniref:Flagellar assembly factor FliW n=1 Tax=Clostridium oryzae TaxID=1450648 RepID=A0A1V4IM77_9CLOT|nr:flagellar assembly protein FliW [Clostridium oryzae]OPJ60875.1 flagellar assembly factor FliW [Clostridium oryzae]